MHAIPRSDSPTEKHFSAPRSRIDIVHSGLNRARAEVRIPAIVITQIGAS